MMHKRNIALWLAGMVAIGIAGAVWQSPLVTAQPVTAAAPAPKPRVAKPVRPTETATIRLPIIVAPAEEAAIHARLAGFIGDRRVEIGDRVKAGQVLAQIDAPEQEREQQQLRAALAQAEAQVRLAAANLRRTEPLVAQGHVSRAILDQRQAEAASAEASRDAVAADLARIQEQLAFREVRAPFDGVVVERLVERGDLVAGDQPGSGEPLFRVARVERLRVVIDAPQSTVASLVPGILVKVGFPEFPGQSFDAKVARTAGLIDRRTGTMRVEAEMDNPDGRIPAGMAGTLELTDGTSQPLRISLAALVTREGKPHVAALREGRVHFLPVVLGRNLGPQVEVLSGLDGNEELLLNPNSLLTDGGPSS